MSTEINYDKIAELSDELTKYNGVLPLLIRALIFKKWVKYLESIGSYDTIIKECIRTMPKDFDEAQQELINWVKMNKEYSDMIKEVN